MARKARTEDLESAAKAASEAARTLQARGQEKRVEEPTTEPRKHEEVDPGHMARALKNRPSSQAMDEILAKRGIDKEPEPEVNQQPKLEEAAPETQQEPAEIPQEPAAIQQEPASPKMAKVKIDGEESEVPQAEIDEAGGIATYQRDKAAEKRLKAANEALAEIKRQQAEMAELLKAKQEPAKPNVSDQQFIAERMEKIRFGTPEEAATAQMEINQRLSKPVDPNDIIERAAQRIKHDAAVAKFDLEFDDIAKNPILLKAVVAIRNERIAQLKGPVDWETFYRTIGNEVRSAVGRPHQSATQPENKTAGTTSTAAKEEKKAAAVVSLPTASARAALPKEEKEPTPDEERKSWFAETKKARGQ